MEFGLALTRALYRNPRKCSSAMALRDAKSNQSDTCIKTFSNYDPSYFDRATLNYRITCWRQNAFQSVLTIFPQKGPLLYTGPQMPIWEDCFFSFVSFECVCSSELDEILCRWLNITFCQNTRHNVFYVLCGGWHRV